MVVIPACFEVTLKELKGVYSDGDPPLPMPNREVKPVSADGTAPGWESRSMPDLEGESIKTRPFFILSRGELVTCQLVTSNLPWVIFFHYLCIYENSDKYNIDRINLVSFIHCRYLFNREKD